MRLASASKAHRLRITAQIANRLQRHGGCYLGSSPPTTQTYSRCPSEAAMNRPKAWWLPALACLFAILFVTPVRAQMNMSFYGIHMDPSGQDARDFSRASYGAGLQSSFPVPGLGNLVAGSVGLELVNMLSETHAFQDPQTGLRVEQQTSQDYFRLFLGPEIGPQGNGFFRPHVAPTWRWLIMRSPPTSWSPMTPIGRTTFGRAWARGTAPRLVMTSMRGRI